MTHDPRPIVSESCGGQHHIYSGAVYIEWGAMGQAGWGGGLWWCYFTARHTVSEGSTYSSSRVVTLFVLQHVQSGDLPY